MRLVALWMLRLLEPAKLAQYADAVVVRLKDADRRVREQALVTLQKLEPSTLAQHADAVVAVARLEYSDRVERSEALRTLGYL